MSPQNDQDQTNPQSTDSNLHSLESDVSWHRLRTLVQDVQAPDRLIIIGDVHGHLPELKALLQKVSFDKENGDHLIFVGDLVNKGPDSPGVVQLAMDLGASAVRGNNEDRVLAAHTAIKRGKSLDLIERLKNPALEAAKNEGDQSEAPVDAKDDLRSLSLGDLKPYSAESDFGTAAKLSDEQVVWLSSLPLILRIKVLKGAIAPPWSAGTLLVAHGGLVPSLPLEKQDPWAVMNMRSLVYPDSEANVPEVIWDNMIKGAKSRTRRYAAFQDATDEEAKIELNRLADVIKNGDGFSAQYKDGLIGFPLESREADWWIDAWNRSQHSIQDPEQRSIVVYGHDARVGLQVGTEEEESDGANELSKVARYTFGLDSGCVYGKKLTAMVVEKRTDGEGLSHSIVQVDAIKQDKD
ncbi:hypothetical protein FSARC_3648 [Fusarium sarcochroum]|uniref:Calcineurin-like phosphoesterase domain-containing protein n=1 Tax=Fusarium sarcochroum TaxID=1208366 RepID=A0A8H4U3W1_9HYPO|nr:hypothetical protein FSARC_3648 [Fusarium sarcochroum]